MQAPALIALERRKAVDAIFRKALADYGLADVFDANEIHIKRHIIVENTGNKNRLSNAILDHMFPRQKFPSDFLHYTKIGGLRGIARSAALRLYDLKNHIDQGEIKTFAEKHRLTGYLTSSEGEPYYKELSDDIFYTSMTQSAAKNDVEMWNVFAEQGTGVRLTLRLTPHDPAELRSIQYELPSRTLLKRLNDALANANEAPFMPWTISKIGAFYLPSSLNVESEVRLLVKRHKDVALPTAHDGANEYLPLPISQPNPFCNIDVLGIELGPNADAAAVKAAVANTALGTIPIQTPEPN